MQIMKTPNLNEIPERFHILFNSDWNAGVHSTMNNEDRMECAKLYNEYNKWVIQETIRKSTPTKEENNNIGFVKD